MTESRSRLFPGLIFRAIFALLLTTGLILFLAALRLSQRDSSPVLTLRNLETVNPVGLPAPPPPPPADTPPPPPVVEDLPKLDIALDPVAPPIKATIDRDIKLRLPNAEFAPRVETAPAQLTFSSSELDTQPRLVSKPNVAFPESLKTKGVDEGKVTLEVLITSSGQVRVRRTLDSSHPELVAMARSFASRSKFTPPNKDGRPVNALFKWPLLLRP